jgi:outer membrane receptor for ferrienterochelin and colicins
MDGGAVRISENQSAYAPTKRVLDLFGIWKFSPKVQLRVSVANALHQDNLSYSTYADSNGTLQSGTLVPTTAVLRGNLEVKF